MATVVHPNFEEITHEVMEGRGQGLGCHGVVVKDSSAPNGVGPVRRRAGMT